jgi:hypothetical protein
MAMRLLRAALLSVALLPLGSCSFFQFLLGSVFPSTVTLLKAQVDLSSRISSDDSHSFSIRIVASAGKDYVVLSGTTGVQGNVVMFFDTDLNLVTRLTTLLIDHFAVFADSTGKVLAGNTLFVPGLASSSLMNTAKVLASNGVGVDGFYAATAPPSDVIFQSQGSSPSFTYQTFSDPLTASQNPSAQISVTLSATPNSNFEMRAVLDDGTPNGNAIVVMVAPNGSNNNSSSPGTSYFLTIPKTAFTSPTTTVAANLVDTAPHRDGLDPNSFGYADGHVIAYDTTIASFVLIDPAAPATVGKSFYSHVDPSEVQFAYPVSSGFYYTYDPSSRALSKYVKWW